MKIAETTETTSNGSWAVECGCNLRQCDSGVEVWTHLLDLMQGQASGRLGVEQEIETRRGLLSALLGMAPKRTRGHFVLEWSGEAASLVFYDRFDVEYRARDAECPFVAGEENHRSPGCGEQGPNLKLARALRATEEYLKTGSRPRWLDYEAVS